MAEKNFSVPDTLRFCPIESPVYPYGDKIRAYLEAGGSADIRLFDYHCEIQARAVEIKWVFCEDSTEGFTLEIRTKPEGPAEKILTAGPDARSCQLPFLLRDTTYYLRLRAEGNPGLTAETSFRTAYLGPRFLDVGGLYHNCRDLGGYRVGDRVTAYNRIFRGSAPDNCANRDFDAIKPRGRSFLEQEVGIRTQLDLRGTHENCGRTDSSFSGANYMNFPLAAYADCFLPTQAEGYRQVFRMLASRDNYPVYVHCVGGADRTGTLSALLLALVGVSEEEIVEDYVVTTFSPVCYQQGARTRENIMTVLNGLKQYPGKTLSEQCGAFLLSIGLTSEEIGAVRANLLGDETGDQSPRET